MPLLDIYLGSKEVKKMLVARSAEFEIPFRYVCEEIGVDYMHFMSSYINAIEATKDPITEKQFEKMLEIFGIEVRTVFVIDKDYNGEAMRLHLKSKYDREKIEKRLRKHGKETGIITDIEQGDHSVDEHDPGGIEFGVS
jgi:hypothetical protein